MQGFRGGLLVPAGFADEGVDMVGATATITVRALARSGTCPAGGQAVDFR